MNKELEKLKESLASLDKKFVQLKGNHDTVNNPELNNQIWNICYDMIAGLRQYVYSIDDRLYEHSSQGHIPKIVGAERMNNALEALGLDGDYRAEPKTIYAYNIQANKNGVELDLKSKK